MKFYSILLESSIYSAGA